jgi:hypothetical protein
VKRAQGLAGAFLIFAASFALHIVGGATDQGWLFVLAVALIYIAAAGFPAIAALIAGALSDRWLWVAGGIIGVVLTAAALRAANDRTLEWWMLPLGIALVAVTSATLVGLTQIRRVFSTRAAA